MFSFDWASSEDASTTMHAALYCHTQLLETTYLIKPHTKKFLYFVMTVHAIETSRYLLASQPKTV